MIQDIITYGALSWVFVVLGTYWWLLKSEGF